VDAKKAAILAGIGVSAATATYLILRKIVPPTPPIEFYCPECGAGPFSYDELMAHYETAHPGAPPIYVCMFCGASFSSLDDLEAHVIAVHRTLWFKVAKFPGAGDPTNTVRITTNLGAVGGDIESGRVGEFPEFNVGLPKDATWVNLQNLDGSALELVKYPIINGIALSEGRIIERSAFWQDNPWHPAALGTRWGLDFVKFSLPPLAIPPQVTVRIEMVTWYPGQIMDVYSLTDSGVTKITTITASSSQLYPNRLYTEITVRAGTYLKLDCISGNLVLVLKKYWRGLQLIDAFANEDLHAGEIQEYWENYGMLRGHYLIFEAVGR